MRAQDLLICIVIARLSSLNEYQCVAVVNSTNVQWIFYLDLNATYAHFWRMGRSSMWASTKQSSPQG